MAEEEGKPKIVIGSKYGSVEDQLRRASQKPIAIPTQHPERFGAPIPPTEMVALFRKGRLGMFEEFWKEKVTFLDVDKKQDRDRWVFLNMGAFNNGTIPNPETAWKGILDRWLSDLTDASRLAKLNPDELKETDESRKDMISMMAISSSARAMDQSGGSAAKVVAMMTQDKEGDLDRQDSWAEFLLQDDPEKYWRVVSNPLVKYYYKRILEHAGLELKDSVDTGEKGKNISDFRVNTREAFGGKLFEYLVKYKNEERGKYKGGFDSYIKEVLLKGDASDSIKKWKNEGFNYDERWAAAKLACDAFLVDKFTRWEYIITEGWDTNLTPNFYVFPFQGWGGDPLRALLEPSFLPRRIKGAYKDDADRAILTMADIAFRPLDIFNGGLKDKDLKASMATHLKHYARLNQAMALFFGSSRAAALPMWTKDAFDPKTGLPQIVELLDQVYGGAKRDILGPDGKPTGEKEVVGKDIVASMITRIIECKAYAAASETARPSLGDLGKAIFDPEKGRPFLAVAQELWGPDYKGRSGFFARCAGPRTRLIFKGNKFKSTLESYNSAYQILISNDQDPNSWWKTDAISIGSKVAAFAEAFARFNP